MKRSACILSAAVFLLAAGCTIEQPGTPRWEVEVTIPIADRMYALNEIIADTIEADTAAVWVSLNGETLYLNFADSLEKTIIGNEIQVSGISKVVVAKVGVLNVNAPGTRSTYFPIPELEPLYGQTVPVFPFSFGPIQQELEEFDEYDWAYLHSGSAQLTVTNNLAVPLNTLMIEVYNRDPYYKLLEWNIDTPLSVGGQATQAFPLPAGPKIDNWMEVHLSGDTPGSETPVYIDENSNIQVDIELSTLEVDSALARFPAQSFSEDTTYAVEEDDSVKTAIIKQGTVSYSITNHTNFYNVTTFKLLDFTLDGVPYTETITIAPNETHTESNFSLVGYQYSRPEQDNKIQAQVWSDILDTRYPPYPNPDDYVYFSKEDTIVTNFSVSPLYFSKFEGYVDDRTLDFGEQVQYFEDIPEGLDSLEVEAASVSIQLSSVIGAPLEINLALDAYKGSSVPAASFSIDNLEIPAGDLENPMVLDTVFTGLEAIVNILPEYIILTGQARVHGQVDVEDWQWVEGKYRIFSPFSLAIGGSTLEPEIAVIEDGFDNKLNQVDLTMNLENHVPLDGEALILASYDSLQLVDYNPNGALVDTFFQMPLPDPVVNQNGYVIEAGISNEENTLDYSQLEMFAGASEEQPLFVKTFIRINSTNGQVVHFQPDDHLTVGASAHLLVDIDFEDEDENGGGL